MDARLADDIIAALNTQTVTVLGSKVAETAAPKRSEYPKNTLLQRKTIGDDIESSSTTVLFPQPKISMPTSESSATARILRKVSDASAFKSSDRLSAYTGIAPVTHRPGSSNRGEHPARFGNPKTQTRPVPIRTRGPARLEQSLLLRPQTD